MTEGTFDISHPKYNDVSEKYGGNSKK